GARSTEAVDPEQRDGGRGGWRRWRRRGWRWGHDRPRRRHGEHLQRDRARRVGRSDDRLRRWERQRRRARWCDAEPDPVRRRRRWWRWRWLHRDPRGNADRIGPDLAVADAVALTH